ncbi:copper chaperone PCu(A)C [Pseudomonadota bacterium]
MTLANASSTPYALTSVSFNAAGMVELHETSMNGKMMQMRRISQIDIPANGSVELKPGIHSCDIAWILVAPILNLIR